MAVKEYGWIFEFPEEFTAEQIDRILRERMSSQLNELGVDPTLAEIVDGPKSERPGFVQWGWYAQVAD